MKGLEPILSVVTGVTGITVVVWSLAANDLLPFIVWCGIVAIGAIVLEERANG